MKSDRNHLKKKNQIFFSLPYKDRTTETTKCSKNKLNQILGAVNALSDLKKEKERIILLKIKHIFRLRKEIDKDKNIGNLFKLKKENETIKDKIIRDITALFE